MGKFNLQSIIKLNLVDPKLKDIAMRAVAKLPFDCVVSEGLRTKQQAILNYCHGRTKEELEAVGIYLDPLPGPKITWTLHSKHIEGKAIDMYPVIRGQLDDGKQGWQNFDEMYHAMMQAASEVKVRLRYGGDWDMDGKLREQGETDSPHFELV
jgi:peptidoglycan L-alanyl-D-glutamate endopeptidase CwlK